MIKKEHIKNISLNKIKPYNKNPRKNDDAVDYVCKSIKENGYITPIIVDNDFIILAGHTRYKAIKKLNIKQCDVIKISGLTEKQKKDFRVMDNKSSELALWDYEALQAEFTPPELEEFGFDLKEDLKEENNTKKSKDIKNVFEVVIECKDEREQEKIYNNISKEGYKCRVLTL